MEHAWSARVGAHVATFVVSLLPGRPLWRSASGGGAALGGAGAESKAEDALSALREAAVQAAVAEAE